jgi:hypothetical protein
MRTNTEKVINAVKSGRKLHTCQAIWTDGVHVYSYVTCIAARQPNGNFVFNTTRYSVTTTIHQNALRVHLHDPRFTEITVDGLEQGCSPESVLLAGSLKKKST